MKANFKTLCVVSFLFLAVGIGVALLCLHTQRPVANNGSLVVSWETMQTVRGGAEGFGCVLGAENTACELTPPFFFCNGCVSGTPSLGTNLGDFAEKSGHTGYFPSSGGDNNNSYPHYPATVNCDRLNYCEVASVANNQDCSGGGINGGMGCVFPAYGAAASGCARAARADDGYWNQAGFGTCVDP